MPPRLRAVVPQNNASSPQLCLKNVSMVCQSKRHLSSTASLQKRQKGIKQPTRLRRQMYSWLNTQGSVFREPLQGSTNYLSAYDFTGRLKRGDPTRENKDTDRENNESSSSQNGAKSDGRPDRRNQSQTLPPETAADLRPFPLNPFFRSQAVTSEELREAVWAKVMKDGQSVANVSAELGVDMNRVGAIVRLKEVEKEWIRKRKALAAPYARAVMGMLPKTEYRPGTDIGTPPHESINDLPVHAATLQQIFYPTSESRHFTRADAAEVFQAGLKPADERVPHPELMVLEKERLAGVPLGERVQRAKARNDLAEKLKAEKEERRMKKEAAATTIVDKGKWEFRFKDISVEAVGKDGRAPGGVGARYGFPHEDRKRGQIKIPTRVD